MLFAAVIDMMGMLINVKNVEGFIEHLNISIDVNCAVFIRKRKRYKNRVMENI